MLPMTSGFLLAGRLSGTSSDLSGLFAVGGLVLMALSFVALTLIPVNFDHRMSAVSIFLSGKGGDIDLCLNAAAIMSSVRAGCRCVWVSVRVTNAGMSLSIGISFSLTTVGLAPTAARDAQRLGLQQQGVPATGGPQRRQPAPPVEVVAALLGLQPDRRTARRPPQKS